MERYNYLESIKSDIRIYIGENFTEEEIRERLEDRESWEEELNEEKDEDLGKIAGLRGVECLFGTDVIGVALCVHHDEHAACGTGRFGKSAGEIEKTGSIYQIDFDVIPLKACNGALQGRLTFLLLRVIVHDGRAVCHFAETLGGARRVQHGFAQGGFAPSGMTRNRNVAYVV